MVQGYAHRLYMSAEVIEHLRLCYIKNDGGFEMRRARAIAAHVDARDDDDDRSRVDGADRSRRDATRRDRRDDATRRDDARRAGTRDAGAVAGFDRRRDGDGDGDGDGAATIERGTASGARRARDARHAREDGGLTRERTFDEGQIAARLDAHLTLPLLEFALAEGTHDAKSLREAKVAVLTQTKMCDWAEEARAEASGSGSASEAKRRRDETVETHAALGKAAERAVKFASDGALIKGLRRDKAANAKFAEDNHGVTSADVDALYKFAKFEYECGDYENASAHLGAVQLLSADNERCESALWGKFAADILLRNWGGALDDMNRLRDALESNASTSTLVKMKQRAWLLHYALYVFFNHPNGRNLIIDVLFQERYMQAVQQEAPHLLRYLAVAIVANKKRRNMLKDLVKIIQSDVYDDPALDFVVAAFVDYDFSKTQEMLKKCDAMIEKDFFLIGCKDAFDENARQYVIENYCKVNKRIDIANLAQMLGMAAADVQATIAALIRGNKLNARIDSEAGFAHVHVEKKSVNEQIIEKTKALLSKTTALTQAVLANTQAQAY